MARRGSNSFRRNDGIRALRVARDGGMEPGALEIVVGPDGGVTFRVYGEKAAGLMPLAPENEADAREWQGVIDKWKANQKPKGRCHGALSSQIRAELRRISLLPPSRLQARAASWHRRLGRVYGGLPGRAR